uniref:Uncharacterized protein n=1 Tax=Anguilla anguilla TaxID=7936 RepID=A0A0E9PI33_ANGAN
MELILILEHRRTLREDCWRQIKI